ncbi:MAG: imidazole glycerol phosphate synthase subunit HisF [Candidatus Atribacteria bacterium]|nr:imidazole glycerol phosphate synthase subunit HisF [Candidatus Atribacteria bacterium]
MYRPRVIPILLLKGQGLVKSVKFKDYRYIGDPINAVKIFNDLKVDELVFLDILASKEKRTVSLDFVRNVGEEANMPFAVGGGIKTIQDIKEIINAGAEKVIINSYSVENPDFIRQASDVFGSSTIVVSIDVKKKFLGKEQVYILGGLKSTGLDPVAFARLMEEKGAGELIINSIEQDGMMVGYDIDLVEKIAKAIHIPVVAVGGAGNLEHMSEVLNKTYASAVGAGSMFVYHGPRRAVLVNYPSQQQLLSLIK